MPQDAAEEQKITYMQGVLKLVAEAPRTVSSPVIVRSINDLHEAVFGFRRSYEKEKQYFNDVMLEREAAVWEKIREAEDPLLRAVQYAIVGNYIDYGAMQQVDEAYLEQLFQRVDEISLGSGAYDALRQDLEKAGRLVYLTDNCGELVLDKLLLRLILERRPELAVTVIVRGSAVLNDATVADAARVGLTDMVRVIDNGNAIAGTWLAETSEEARRAIDTADLILSKGQANFETLSGCGRNVYYLFLCKCEMFARQFGVERYTGILIRDGACG